MRSRVYTFDAASQVTQVVEGGVTTGYGYDAAGQLVSETKSTGYSGAYTYDANGNRLSRTVNGVLETYSYDAGDKLLAVSGGLDPRTFVYDAAGRTTSIVRASGTTAFVYDYESRVVSVSGPGFGNSMAYNGLDTRVSLADSGGTKVFKRDGVSVTAPVLGDGTAVFSPGVGEKRGSVKTYFHHGLKNTDAQSSAAGVLAAVREYDAFGNVVSGSGVWASQFGNAGRLRVDTG